MLLKSEFINNKIRQKKLNSTKNNWRKTEERIFLFIILSEFKIDFDDWKIIKPENKNPKISE